MALLLLRNEADCLVPNMETEPVSSHLPPELNRSPITARAVSSSDLQRSFAVLQSGRSCAASQDPTGFPLAKAVPKRTIAHPAIITGVIASPRKAAPQIIPKIWMRNVTDAA